MMDIIERKFPPNFFCGNYAPLISAKTDRAEIDLNRAEIGQVGYMSRSPPRTGKGRARKVIGKPPIE